MAQGHMLVRADILERRGGTCRLSLVAVTRLAPTEASADLRVMRVGQATLPRAAARSRTPRTFAMTPCASYLHAYESVAEARQQLASYFTFYNTRRPHSSLDGMTPDTAYFAKRAIQSAA
jgi:transposase InsO family protein